jgi:hypothetical protein
MRYLYGDLSEFPLQENVLEQLMRFVHMGVAVLTLDHEVGGLIDAISHDRTQLADTLAQMDGFEEQVHQAIVEAVAERPGSKPVAALAEGSLGQLERTVHDGKQRVVAGIQARIAETERTIADRQAQTREHLQAFFVDSQVPLGGNAMKVEFLDGAYQATSEILDVVGLLSAFRLQTGGSEFFSAPRRLVDLISERLDVPVGLKKTWLKKEPVVEAMRVDDALITKAVDTEEWGEFQLARKGNGVEGVRVRVPKATDLPVDLIRLGASGERVPVSAELVKLEHSERLRFAWDQLQPRLRELYRRRGDMVALRIGDDDVVSERLLPAVVKRLVAFLAPTVREIAARSPAKSELCLKVEHDSDRREEIFLQKVALLNQLVTAPLGSRALFEPLGLHRGVPGFSAAFYDGDENEGLMSEEPTAPG